jgi:DNA-binding NtrC family response regulator
MQVKLLRVLQTGEVCRIGEHKSLSVDLRIIAATNAQLKQRVDRGGFREDLFYRLNVFPIVIPPLRQRPDDILPLARHILKRCAQSLNKADINFTPAAEQVLSAYDWPGNVRELENVVERASNIAGGNRVDPGALGLPGVHLSEKSSPTAPLEEVEKQAIMQIIQELGFNLSKASRTLGISRATLYNKIKKYGLSINRLNV